MNNCFVKKLDATISNPNLKPIFENYKDYAEAKGGDVQYVQIVGSGLAIETVKTATHKMSLTFKHGERENKDSFCLEGKNLSNGTRLRLESNSRSLTGSAYSVQAAYGDGGQYPLASDLTPGVVYTAVFEKSKVTLYNANGTVVATITVTTYDTEELASISVFNIASNPNYNNGFTVLNVKISNSDNEVILDAYPAIDGDGYGCLYDDVNQCYYHANSGQLTVGNFD